MPKSATAQPTKQIYVRVPVPIYEVMVACAKSSGQSINSWVCQKIAQGVATHRDPITGRRFVAEGNAEGDAEGEEC